MHQRGRDPANHRKKEEPKPIVDEAFRRIVDLLYAFLRRSVNRFSVSLSRDSFGFPGEAVVERNPNNSYVTSGPPASWPPLLFAGLVSSAVASSDLEANDKELLLRIVPFKDAVLAREFEKFWNGEGNVAGPERP